MPITVLLWCLQVDADALKEGEILVSYMCQSLGG